MMTSGIKYSFVCVFCMIFFTSALVSMGWSMIIMKGNSSIRVYVFLGKVGSKVDNGEWQDEQNKLARDQSSAIVEKTSGRGSEIGRQFCYFGGECDDNSFDHDFDIDFFVGKIND